ncbi:DNA methyltransferase [Shewanella sp. phage 1/40]|uniref:DNA methyltransferase n=1 Tax=Shewanella sp. phage 1/40 TaxID=1458860 RepID=UPI0004F7A7D5|nr:DNA methyltransferase [Shewanella sp. phage 1/40]AHK11441.1 DNA methyltransferase [Shewanella sp. phage 1/40]
MATANTKRNKDAHSNDLYTTSNESLQLLWDNAPQELKRATTVVDNSFGLGDITRFFKDKGKTVHGFDLVNYGDSYAEHLDCVEYGDFLNATPKTLDRNHVMVFNPPFTLTYEFIEQSLLWCDDLFIFNRLNTLESIKRANKFKSKEWPLKKVYVFGKRVSCPKGVEYEASPNATAYCWLHVQRGYEGEPILCWI